MPYFTKLEGACPVSVTVTQNSVNLCEQSSFLRRPDPTDVLRTDGRSERVPRISPPPGFDPRVKPTSLTRVSELLQAGWSGDRMPEEAEFSAPVETGPGAHPSSNTMDTASLCRGKAAGPWF